MFSKRRPDVPTGFFEVEAAGLRWLRVPEGVSVAAVVSVAPDEIVLERVAQRQPTHSAAARFGRRLAVTHDAGAAMFGSPPTGWSGDGFIADLPLSLRPTQRWGEFYAEQRVLPYARQSARSGSLSSSGLDLIETLAERLASGEFDDAAPPARIHGDLWAGNVLFSGDSATLIDPAAHGGHRITDLAMLELFGLPYLSEALAAYADASQWLPSGWRDLIGLHQLHPLLVHAALFGGSYGEQAVRVARRY
ncbi:MAG TPA: fructosamine kinase family protein [Propionicimonas sp.]|nr:fructosamine kinase family protein [Propionicimonas sp.]HQA79058.1 fructosamine kinase family protein [Propionicimonas sp.]